MNIQWGTASVRTHNHRTKDQEDTGLKYLPTENHWFLGKPDSSLESMSAAFNANATDTAKHVDGSAIALK